MTTDLENVAKQVGVSINALQSNIDEVVSSNAEAWTSAGISADDQQKRAIRIAARQLITRSRAIASSGCVELKGVFVASPPYKDWAKMAYNKMSKTLNGLDAEAIDKLVEGGSIVTYYADSNGGYTRTANPSLLNKTEFVAGTKTDTVSELPNNTMPHAYSWVRWMVVMFNWSRSSFLAKMH